jgi:transcriptional regulator with XRE-family HTH domain
MGASVDRRVFRDRLVAQMKERNLKAAEVARLAEISKDAMSSYTSMRSIPTDKTLAKLARVLKCKKSDLIPPLSHDQINTIVELREYPKPNYKLLVARAPLPADVAMKVLKVLLEHTDPIRLKAD